jgi:hypothetical protein
LDLGSCEPAAERIFHKRDQFVVNCHDSLALGAAVRIASNAAGCRELGVKNGERRLTAARRLLPNVGHRRYAHVFTSLTSQHHYHSITA